MQAKSIQIKDVLQSHNRSYELCFARSEGDLTEVQRLRYTVFNEELNEGLNKSRETGLDADEFDPQCQHLFVRFKKTGEVVGTYRMQSYEIATSNLGFYSATVFDLHQAPIDFLKNSVEIGRACIRQDHRSLQVLYLLWKGIGHYCKINHKRYLFGCCSITGQNESEAWAVQAFLKNKGHIHSSIFIPPLDSHRCQPTDAETSRTYAPPRLMRTYLSLGAKICSPPAIDREFKTIDFLTLFDLTSFDAQSSVFYHLKS